MSVVNSKPSPDDPSCHVVWKLDVELFAGTCLGRSAMSRLKLEVELLVGTCLGRSANHRLLLDVSDGVDVRSEGGKG